MWISVHAVLPSKRQEYAVKLKGSMKETIAYWTGHCFINNESDRQMLNVWEWYREPEKKKW